MRKAPPGRAGPKVPQRQCTDKPYITFDSSLQLPDIIHLPVNAFRQARAS